MRLVNGEICHPFSMIVTGSSMSGKTEFVVSLLRARKNLISSPINRIIWCYGQETEKLSHLKREFGRSIQIIPGIPENLVELLKKHAPNGVIVIFDDLVDSICNNKQVFDLFIKGVHHMNVSVICVLQDFYAAGNYRVSMIRNTNYLAIFPSPMDMALIDLISRKVLPRKQDQFYAMFKHAATSVPYGYLFISGHPESDSTLRFRTDIFGEYQVVLEPT